MTSPLPSAATAAATIAVVALLLALTSCATDPKPGADYRPAKTDAQIYREIAALPHITDVDIQWVDDFSQGNTYTGEVTVTAERYIVETLDHVNALLRQGRFGAYPSVGVVGNNLDISLDSVGLSASGAIEDRYGPQPGTGEPPANPLPSVEITSSPAPSPITRVPSP